VMRKKKELEQIHRDVEEIYDRVERLNLQIREVLEMLRHIRNREYSRQIRDLAQLPRKPNVHFEHPQTGLVELIPTGNVLRVFRYRKRPYPGGPSIPFVRVALLQEAAPLQNEDTQYAPRFLIVRYDDPVHELRLHRILLKIFSPSQIPWVREGRLEVFQSDEPPSRRFDLLASMLHESEYEVFTHYVENQDLMERAEAEDEDDED